MPKVFSRATKTNASKTIKSAAAFKGPSKKELEQLVVEAEKPHAQNAVVDLFAALAHYAYAKRASDIHIEPWEKYSFVRLRIDGILHDELQCAPAVHTQLVARLKILTRMRTDEHHAPQDGRFKFSAGDEAVDVRASIIPTTLGEKVVLRLLSSQSHKLTLEQ